MRRKDREVTAFGDILSILSGCEVLRLALVDGDRPYVVPLNFGYRAQGERLTLYFHGAGEGRKIDIIRKNPAACFEVDGAFRVRRAALPCGWSAEHESVIGEGRVSVVENRLEKKKAMDAIMQRYGFNGIPAYDPATFDRTTVLKLEVDRLSGKRSSAG